MSSDGCRIGGEAFANVLRVRSQVVHLTQGFAATMRSAEVHSWSIKRIPGSLAAKRGLKLPNELPRRAAFCADPCWVIR